VYILIYIYIYTLEEGRSVLDGSSFLRFRSVVNYLIVLNKKIRVSRNMVLVKKNELFYTERFPKERVFDRSNKVYRNRNESFATFSFVLLVMVVGRGIRAEE